MSTAAVGSLMIRTTSSPASSPAWRVACRWPSLKKAGTVMTTFETGTPSAFSARCFSVLKMIAEISWGEYFWSPRVTVTSWPIFRLIDRTVRSGASTYWLRAALPTSRWPWGSRPTTDGKIGSPSSSRTTGRPSRMTATSLLVVPRSMPMIVSVFMS